MRDRCQGDHLVILLHLARIESESTALCAVLDRCGLVCFQPLGMLRFLAWAEACRGGRDEVDCRGSSKRAFLTRNRRTPSSILFCFVLGVCPIHCLQSPRPPPEAESDGLDALWRRNHAVHPGSEERCRALFAEVGTSLRRGIPNNMLSKWNPPQVLSCLGC